MKIAAPACLLLAAASSTTDAFQPVRRSRPFATAVPLPAATTFSTPIRNNGNDDDGGTPAREAQVQQVQRAVHIPESKAQQPPQEQSRLPDVNVASSQANPASEVEPQQVQRAVFIPSTPSSTPASSAPKQAQQHELTQQQRRRQEKRRRLNASRRGYQEADNDTKAVKLLDEFTTANGDVVDPYKILKVPRDADRQDIRKAYVTLSKRYHPDGARQMKILPGNCNNLDEVRDQWERIKLSYEILGDKKTRQRYDRHAAIADPGAALQRATFNAMGKGVMGLGKGLFNVGAMAVSSIATVVVEKGPNDKDAPPSDEKEKK